MKIEVWSDIVCPFCYMGKRHVELAKAQFPQNLDIQMAYRSFELDPNATPSQHGNIHELLAHKYDTSVEQARLCITRSQNGRLRSAWCIDLTP